MKLRESQLLAAGFALRIILLAYGMYMDRHPILKYTDIDYSVFTDAASQVSQGRSPYMRQTYRYSPLLAWLLLPTLLVPIWGKVLFLVCDLLVGKLLLTILKQSVNESHAINLAAIWIMNPFVAIISTRGNCESIISLLVIGTLWAISVKRLTLSAILYGFSVHLKIYPIIYCIPIWFGIDYAIQMAEYRSLNHKKSVNDTPKKKKRNDNDYCIIPKFKLQLWSNERFQFGLISACTFLGLNLIMYLIYGYQFLSETYLYHLIRKDHRHNFSLYFYNIYLSYDMNNSDLMAILLFVPQILLIFFLGYSFSHDLNFAFFVQTFAFVMLNKVCTSQYFMWYLCLIPLVLMKSNLCTKNIGLGLALIVSWVGGQALWLLQAYQLEHLGHNTFRSLFYTSSLFYGIQVWITCEFIKNIRKENK